MSKAFTGERGFLSSFYPAPVFGYPSVEHAYQAAKTTDRAVRQQFRVGTAAAAKAAGKRLAIRPDWDAIKLHVMTTLVREKFTRHVELKALLLATGDEPLIEENWWGDRFWGTCNGTGENHLGRILMQVRTELEGTPPTPETVFVFGSNTEGRHGRGAARTARIDYGAIYGQAEGRQGNAYGIVTKELRAGLLPITLKEVEAGVKRFMAYAEAHPEIEFKVTKVGCGLAGFREEDIKPLFTRYRLVHVHLPIDW